MKIDILNSDPGHPVRPHLERWANRQGQCHKVNIYEKASQCDGGTLLFMISCNEMVGADVRNKYDRALVIHASDLPQGRGWSPLVWQVLEGRDKIALSLFEAVDEVDAGPIFRKSCFKLSGDELFDEINRKLFDAELALMDYAVANFNSLKPEKQSEGNASYYRKRTPRDSRLDLDKSISEQFDLLRVADPERYPCFFEIRGHSYKVTIEKMKSGCDD